MVNLCLLFAIIVALSIRAANTGYQCARIDGDYLVNDGKTVDCAYLWRLTCLCRNGNWVVTGSQQCFEGSAVYNHALFGRKKFHDAKLSTFQPSKAHLNYDIGDTMAPDQIRYCQDSCGRRFKDGRLLSETVQQLRAEGSHCVDRIPKIRVFWHKGYWFTEDNRRLWCFREANITSIPVVKSERISAPSKMTTANNGTSIRVRGY